MLIDVVSGLLPAWCSKYIAPFAAAKLQDLVVSRDPGADFIYKATAHNVGARIVELRGVAAAGLARVVRHSALAHHVIVHPKLRPKDFEKSKLRPLCAFTDLQAASAHQGRPRRQPPAASPMSARPRYCRRECDGRRPDAGQ